MAYANINFQTRKELKFALAQGRTVTLWSPSPFPVKENGQVTVEGPHFPKPHRWYAVVEVVNGKVTKVLS